MSFLPVSMEDIENRGWGGLDFLYVSGDAYVDHPSFGHAVITRVLESHGFRVGILPQPSWKDKSDFLKLGKPRLGVLVSSGVIDSMVNHYTVSKKKRGEDLYSPGGKSGFRPDRAVIVYCNRLREAFGDLPIIIGGVESSLRRFAHYDYWDDRVRRSILVDSRADILVYGMGESPIVQIAKLLERGVPIKSIKDIRGTCVLLDEKALKPDAKTFLKSGDIESEKYVLLDSFESVREDEKSYARAFMKQYKEQDYVYGKTLIQEHFGKYLFQNPPIKPMTQKELDRVYALPYQRDYHPMYRSKGGIPAIKEVKFSVVSHRGCFGGCSFCSINFHQGRVIQKRSKASILKEAQDLVFDEEFKGYIHDVGGPTANFRNKACQIQEKQGVCKNKQCLSPEPCKNLKVSHKEYLDLLDEIRKIQGVKKVFIRSGIRYDYLMLDGDDSFFRSLCQNHVSGQLKVAPEHVCPNVLAKMGKPEVDVYKGFVKKYEKLNKALGLEQYLVPYLLSSHPGSTLDSAIALAEYLKSINFNPKQVQDFYPTPGTLSTCMFHTQIDPRTGQSVYVPTTFEEKKMQRALLQFRKKENKALVIKALKKAGRNDLIGFGKKCLVRP